ncbi:hypothetical protein NG798_04815 [Ancylothrix sp. C2]|uniref:hypothetical protein n=1 Tax=Ancylothrix sp. D3o TaxID=2953691 RepID=UPI0021BB9CD0|nr:hypothetical protein [Ancylothrix sp. D3o]MCT7949100.1 hypothetical protein [Ancylothrix sp. D3o]
MPTNPLELAKQGDPNAIAALLNRTLQPKGITATAEQQGGFLHVLLHSTQVAPHKQIVEFIQQGMNKLESPVIHTVRIDSYQTGSDSPAWSDEFGLESALIDQSDFPPIMDDPSLDDYSDSEDMMGNQPRYDDPQYDELPQEGYEDGDGQEEEEEEEEPQPAKAKRQPPKLLLLLLGLLALALLGVGAAFALKLGPFAETAETPPPPAPSSAKQAAPANATPAAAPKPATPAPATKPATPAAATKPATPAANTPKPAANTPKPATATDPWRDAVKKAETAGNLGFARPQTPQEWEALGQQWQAAIDAMKKVPANHPKYKEAQQKIKEYQINLDYAKQNAGT